MVCRYLHEIVCDGNCFFPMYIRRDMMTFPQLISKDHLGHEEFIVAFNIAINGGLGVHPTPHTPQVQVLFGSNRVSFFS